jgi:Holliday junction resolvase
MTNYVRGRAAEYKAIKILRSKNFLVLRSAGSHGPCDLIAASPDGERFVIQIKSGNAKPTQHERIALKFLASRFQAKAQVWIFKPRQPCQVETL